MRHTGNPVRLLYITNHKKSIAIDKKCPAETGGRLCVGRRPLGVSGGCWAAAACSPRFPAAFRQRRGGGSHRRPPKSPTSGFGASGFGASDSRPTPDQTQDIFYFCIDILMQVCYNSINKYERGGSKYVNSLLLHDR